jgi:hypothetical protein
MATIAVQRLANQRITRRAPRPPAGVVAWLGAVQAQEYGPAKWAVALRVGTGVTDALLDRAVDRGRILRTHVLRPTWHFVAPADIRWMLELTAPQVHRRMAPYDRRLGLDAGVKRRAAAIFERALGDHGFLTRAELGAHLARAGLPSRSYWLAHLAMYAELEGVICSGPRRGKHFTYGLVAERAPRAPRLGREEAIARLARRFLQSHGPATHRDFAWWSGLSTPDAKRGLEMIRARPREMEGLTYWTLRSAAVGAPARPSLHLLPVYDEYLVAYRDRAAVPHVDRTTGAYGGAYWHTVVVNGQVAATWKTARHHDRVVIDVTMLKGAPPVTPGALRQAARRYGRFLELPVAMRLR